MGPLLLLRASGRRIPFHRGTQTRGENRCLTTTEQERESANTGGIPGRAARDGPECDVNASKFDGEKPRLHLVPNELVNGAARAFGFGAKKYARYNWMKGMEW